MFQMLGVFAEFERSDDGVGTTIYAGLSKRSRPGRPDAPAFLWPNSRVVSGKGQGGGGIMRLTLTAAVLCCTALLCTGVERESAHVDDLDGSREDRATAQPSP